MPRTANIKPYYMMPLRWIALSVLLVINACRNDVVI